jgi:hypothetical protein
MKEVSASTASEAADKTLYKVELETNDNNVTAENYMIDYVIADPEPTHSGWYIKPTALSPGNYYKPRALNASDFSSWYYAKDVINYIEITSSNPLPTGYNSILYKDANGTEEVGPADVLVGIDTGTEYVYDVDGDGPQIRDAITEDDIGSITNLYRIYKLEDGSFVPLDFIGYYYAAPGIQYDQITSENYNNTTLGYYTKEDSTELKMYKENSGVYSEITFEDYYDSGFYFWTNFISYEKIDDKNFYRERSRYKKVNNDY